MRKIKFRAWDTSQISSSWMIHWDDLKHCTIDYFMQYEKRIMMQFTGLRDKNGKEIYEGDIIKHFGDYGIVKFQKGCFKATWNTKSTLLIDFIMGTRAEVIGNIHENPELIVVEK